MKEALKTRDKYDEALKDPKFVERLNATLDKARGALIAWCKENVAAGRSKDMVSYGAFADVVEKASGIPAGITVAEVSHTTKLYGLTPQSMVLGLQCAVLRYEGDKRMAN